MHWSEEDIRWMRLALEVGHGGDALSAPNPSVGCVIVRDGKEIARGHTQTPGGHHAEIEAIEAAKTAGETLVNATLYVTLEPCSHYGRTPPCAKRIIDEGVSRVVVAVKDPNPLVSGRGIAMLAEAGIEVALGVCEAEAKETHRAFFKRIETGLPWVEMKLASTLDGKSALSNGLSRWITSEEARRDGHLWREKAQGILTGIGTVLSDDPRMNARTEKGDFERKKYVVDSNARCPTDAAIFKGGRLTVFVCEDADRESVARLEKAGAAVLPVKTGSDGKPDLTQVLRRIAEDGVNTLHVEAGARLNGALLDADLVDEIVAYVAPSVMGEGLGLAKTREKTTIDELRRWTFADLARVGDDIRLVMRKKK